MCGIIGIASAKPVSGNIIEALKKLEYRGYDSAGLSTIDNNEINEKKCSGRVDNLEKILFENPSKGNLGIGHVRWATHGIPNKINAHPHSSEVVSVVHNGIIENSNSIKNELIKKNYLFKSQTDTEVITLLLTNYLKNYDILDSVHKTLERLEGSFALGIIFKNFKDIVVGARRGSPLAVGYGHEENYIGSDSYALKSMTNKISYLEDGEICILTRDKVEFYNSEKNKINKEILTLSNDENKTTKGDFKDFMSKEINEQPVTSKTCLKEYIDYLRKDINFYNFPINPNEVNKITLIGCGTAYHSCLIAKYLFEDLTSITVETDIASEFRYRKVKFKKNNLYVFVSQSGETADTFAALDLCKKNKANTCAIVNVVESSIARTADFVLPIHAGPEIGVASTKAFIGQMLVLYLLSLKISKVRNEITDQNYTKSINDLNNLPSLFEKVLAKRDEIQIIAKDFVDSKGTMFLGRGFSYPIALEGALKLKEISYIHATGYPAGELKHGPIALVERDTPVVAVVLDDATRAKTLNAVAQIRSRDGRVILVASEGDDIDPDLTEDVILVPRTSPLIAPMIGVVPLQLFAYHVAVLRGLDVDQPRNLAKSVTVE